MATRHDVTNLERRGHTFYWRARVPVRFRQVRRQARLSFSLRLSDHGKAAYTARRLNTLLADLTVRPTAAMTTKDQLDQIFRAEIERMTAHLEDTPSPRAVWGRPTTSTRWRPTSRWDGPIA
ncbi:DUF6538 domain-containing protein [Aureimonas leprariae]|uniref:DUF6538 domain-containing protein n=1 Tax=Plantimonas leprariae TaxID=2615207 RepID=UPI00192A43F0|nr:DUF6538 domain-containing protein [Aureimonas leprariae]